MYIIVLALTRVSLLLFLRRLTPVKKQQTAVDGLTGMVCAWMIAAIFAIAFTCDFSNPWITVGHECSGWVSAETPRMQHGFND